MADWLQQEPIASRRACLRLHVIVGTDDDDRNCCCEGIRLESSAGFQAAEERHGHIHDDEIWSKLPGLPNAILTVDGLHNAEARFTQDPAPNVPNVLRIVDKEDE
jgi:hypothetical protein